jgi:beta-galactosidase
MDAITQLLAEDPNAFKLALITTLFVSAITLNFFVACKSKGAPALRWRYCVLRAHQSLVKAAKCVCCVGCYSSAPWETPTIFKTGNVLDAHVPLRVYDNVDEALKDIDGSFPFDLKKKPLARKYRLSKWQHSLDGTWQFKLFPRPDAIEGGMPPNVPTLAQPGTHNDILNNTFGTINVPGCWEMQGHGIPIYTNIQYPWLLRGQMCKGWCKSFPNIFAGFHAGSVPKENPTGLYRRSFHLPSSWCEDVQEKKRKVILHLGAVSSAARVFVNGIDVGYFQDSFTETEIDITGAVIKHGVEEEHVIVLQVIRFSDGSWLEDQDHWWFSGIHRSVFLQCRPTLNAIVDYHTRTEEKGVIHVDVYIGSPTKDSIVNFVLYDENKNIVSETSRAINGKGKGTGTRTDRRWKCESILHVKNPKRWSSEDPNLYTLSIETDVHCEICRVGFRTCSISTIKDDGKKDDQHHQRYFLLNGRPLVIAGINYHEHDRYTGKTVSQEGYAEDLWMMKNANFNAVRTCHYPHDHRFYELCDEIGLMVCDEANIETHGFALLQQMSYLTCHPSWKGAFVDRVMTMCARARNYTCIVTWSLGNESGYGPNHEAAAKQLRAADPSRPLQYEGGRKHGDAVFILGTGHGPTTVTDFICPMYHSPAELAQVSRDPTETRPIVSCEYLHAMGNSTGNAKIYWDAVWNFKLEDGLRSIQGGYVWDWMDQALVDPHDPSRKVCYGGDLGPTSGLLDAQFCINGLIFADRTPHPGLKEMWKVQSPILLEVNSNKQLVITNRYRFIDLTHLKFTCRISRETEKEGSLILFEKRLDLSKNFNYDKGDTFTPGGRYTSKMEIAKEAQIHKVKEEGSIWLDVLVERKANHRLTLAASQSLVASERFLLRRETCASSSSSSSESSVSVKEINQKQLQVKGKTYTMLFDKDTSQFISMLSAQGNRIMSSCDHSFFRAPTDNDNGGLAPDKMGGELIPLLRCVDKVFCTKLSTEGVGSSSFHSYWRAVGLDTCRTFALEPINVIKGSTLVQEDVVRAVRGMDGIPTGPPLFRITTTWTFRAASYTMDVKVVAQKAIAHLPSLPRIGVHMELANDLNLLQYYGKGPHECYSDRKESAVEGIHQMDIDKCHVQYVVPSENGGRCDVQWLSLSSNTVDHRRVRILYTQLDDEEAPAEQPLTGFFIHDGGCVGDGSKRPAGGKGAQINVSRFSVNELAAANHDDELVRSLDGNVVHLHVDSAHMGVGGDTGWTPETHHQYRIKAGAGTTWHYTLDFNII